MKEKFSPPRGPEPLSNEGQSRREFLGSLARAGLGAYLMRIRNRDRGSETQGVDNELGREKPARPERQKRESRFTTGQLAGELMKEPLFQYYFGLDGKPMPAELEVNFSLQLAQLWQTKNSKASNNPAVSKVGEVLLADYIKYEPTPSDISKFGGEAGQAIEQILDKLDWDNLAKDKELSAEDLKLVQSLTQTIGGKELIGLCITELMPSKNPDINVAAMELLLKHAGKEFIENIPAIYDKLLSFGPYQFTHYALGVTEQGAMGASNINQYLPKDRQIVNELSLLKGADHHKAAILNIIENFTALVSRIRFQQKPGAKPEEKPIKIERENAEILMRQLEQAVTEQPEEIILFAAAAHHGPSPAISAALKWLDPNNTETYLDHCPESINHYAARMQRSLRGLTEHSRRNSE